MVHYSIDYYKAKMEETRILPYLKEYFNSPLLTATDSQYEQYDFVDTSFNYEMKSRFNVKRDQYDTTLIQSDKFIPRGKYQNKPVMLIFNFVDYLCYIKYNPDLFKTFLTTDFARQKDQVQHSSAHTFIPKEHLNTICKWSDLTSCSDCKREYPKEMMGHLVADGLAEDLYYCPICLDSGNFEIEYN